MKCGNTLYLNNFLDLLLTYTVVYFISLYGRNFPFTGKAQEKLKKTNKLLASIRQTTDKPISQ